MNLLSRRTDQSCTTSRPPYSIVQRMTQLRLHNSIGKYRLLVNRYLVNCPWNLSWKSVRALPSLLAEQQAESLQKWGRSECEELRLRRHLPLACGVMCFVSSRVQTVKDVFYVFMFLCLKILCIFSTVYTGGT